MIAWDLDNTLIDRDAALRSFFAKWLGRRFSTREAGELLPLICADDRSGEGDRGEFCARALERCGLPRSGATDLWGELQRGLPDCIVLDPRVAQLVNTLSSTYSMFIVTNGGSTLQRAKVRQAGLDAWFDPSRVFVSSEVGAAKPQKALFHAALSSMSVAPANVLFIGDHAGNDIRGAADCGMQTCWVSLGRARPATLPADMVVERVWEVGPLLAFPASILAP